MVNYNLQIDPLPIILCHVIIIIRSCEELCGSRLFLKKLTHVETQYRSVKREKLRNELELITGWTTASEFYFYKVDNLVIVKITISYAPKCFTNFHSNFVF